MARQSWADTHRDITLIMMSHSRIAMIIMLLKTVKSQLNITQATLAVYFVLVRGLTSGSMNTKDITYSVDQGLQLSGCQFVNLNMQEKSRLACAIFCSTDSNCATFKFLDVSSDCMTCRRNEVTGINFITGEFTSLPRVMRQSNWPFDRNQYMNRSVTVPGGIKAGMVVHLTGMVLSVINFSITFEQADDRRDVNFLLNARTVTGSQDHILVLNNRQDNVWGTEIRPVISPYPFQANTSTTLHILVTEVMFIVYIDNMFCCNYTHVPGMLYTKVNYIRVTGGMQVFEISS